MYLNTLRSLTGLALASALLTTTVPAQAQQQLLPAQSSIDFSARQMGVPLQGHFKKFDAQLAFDPARLATSRIRFTPWVSILRRQICSACTVRAMELRDSRPEASSPCPSWTALEKLSTTWN